MNEGGGIGCSKPSCMSNDPRSNPPFKLNQIVPNTIGKEKPINSRSLAPNTIPEPTINKPNRIVPKPIKDPVIQNLINLDPDSKYTFNLSRDTTGNRYEGTFVGTNPSQNTLLTLTPELLGPSISVTFKDMTETQKNGLIKFFKEYTYTYN
jgi:hypothetical protein